MQAFSSNHAPHFCLTVKNFMHLLTILIDLVYVGYGSFQNSNCFRRSCEASEESYVAVRSSKCVRLFKIKETVSLIGTILNVRKDYLLVQ
ncbi:hypothetical protein M758_3G072900 [Ceratodon purpureus]|nr:hypothetical protein M758_3G072900 [Ceratodon purpureus]